MTALAYNLVIGVVDLLALWLVKRRSANGESASVPARLISAVGLLAGLGGVLAFGLGEDPFGIMRLACWGLFVHGPAWAMLAGATLLPLSRGCGLLGIVAGVLLIAVGVDAFLIEPTWLEVTHVEVASDKLSQPVTIAVIADFQTDSIGAYERRVLEEVKRQRPDLVLWAGDYLQEADPGRWGRLRDEFRDLLQQVDLRPRLGSYAVGGNVDNPRWPEIFYRSEVQVFVQNGQAYAGEVAVSGLAVGQSFRTQAQIPPADQFHIVLGHCPNFALGEVDADLLVAGHVHGGQVRLPGIGPLITNSRLSRSLAAGVTRLGEGRTLAVSRGIGMERSHAPRLRFLCRPELMMIHLVPAKHPAG